MILMVEMVHFPASYIIYRRVVSLGRKKKHANLGIEIIYIYIFGCDYLLLWPMQGQTRFGTVTAMNFPSGSASDSITVIRNSATRVDFPDPVFPWSTGVFPD